MKYTKRKQDFLLGNLERTGYTLEADFVDYTTQTTTTTDTAKTVLYGPLKTSTNGLLQMAADGVLTILKTGPYAFKSRTRIGRSGASGISNVVVWIETSIDGGVTWVLTGNPVCALLNTSSDLDLFFDFTPARLNKGTKLRARWARDSAGDNSGDLRPFTLSGPLAALVTVSQVASAQVSAYRINGFEYV